MSTYPRMLHKPDGTHVIVHDEQDEHEKRGEGWQLHARPRAHEHDANADHIAGRDLPTVQTVVVPAPVKHDPPPPAKADDDDRDDTDDKPKRKR